MSKYQYYEFQAIDRPLTQREMAELRALSTRAELTPNRFVNVDHYGDFRGDPRTLMEKYFDAFIYVATWGTHQCMVRLPRPLLDRELAVRYCPDDDVAALHTTADHVILDFTAYEEEMMTSEESSERWRRRSCRCATSSPAATCAGSTWDGCSALSSDNRG
jgi:hypothetical protein